MIKKKRNVQNGKRRIKMDLKKDFPLLQNSDIVYLDSRCYITKAGTSNR